MSDADVELLRDFYAHAGRGDFSAVLDIFDQEVVFARILGDAFLPGPGGSGTWRGRDAMVEAVVDWIRNWDDVRHEAEEFIDLGDRVVILTHQAPEA